MRAQEVRRLVLGDTLRARLLLLVARGNRTESLNRQKEEAGRGRANREAGDGNARNQIGAGEAKPRVEAERVRADRP